MASYLVTGGAGFIGSNIVEHLIGLGHHVRVLDNLCEGRKENLAEVMDKITFVVADLRDRQAVGEAVGGVDYVLHQAALRSVPRSVVDPLSTTEVNITGTVNLLVAARDARVKRVVFAASSSVYGDAKELPLSESLMPRPISPYAVSKVTGEYYCSAFTKLYGLETVSLRYFNVFGPRQDPQSEYAAVIARFTLAALRGEPLEIHGDGLQSRDFTYIANVVNANLLAATKPGIAGEVFNVGCGERYSILDIKACLEKILGKQLEAYHTPSRQGDVRHTQADTSKAEALLGHTPTVGFEEGMRRTVEYFRLMQ
jgi:UDP-glucose 4-epimerase